MSRFLIKSIVVLLNVSSDVTQMYLTLIKERCNVSQIDIDQLINLYQYFEITEDINIKR